MRAIAIMFLLLSIVLVSGGCVETSSEVTCVPASCCHPTECVTSDQAPDCSGLLCTQECVPGTLDCQQGYCEAIDGECVAVFND